MTSASSLPERGRTVRWPKMRPRFVVEVDCEVGHVMHELRAAASAAEPRVAADLATHNGVLSVPETERAFWSTYLDLTLERRPAPPDAARGSTRVLGVFSPQPEIWTAYVFTIGSLVVAAIFGVMVAIVQLALGDVPWGLLVTLVAVLLGALVYTTTLVGQGLAADEMYRLRSHLDECLQRAEARARDEPPTALESARL